MNNLYRSTALHSSFSCNMIRCSVIERRARFKLLHKIARDGNQYIVLRISNIQKTSYQISTYEDLHCLREATKKKYYRESNKKQDIKNKFSCRSTFEDVDNGTLDLNVIPNEEMLLSVANAFHWKSVAKIFPSVIGY
ncbi:unnamed protein product [Lactuca saligna]|uniref:Uncharacterized protein n=1 Tax=Lactuca saligna TaxID=75948 RepID=A0AA36EHK0_LACSI|nr:unnamed protein product [Lactuca saligna]